MSSISSLQKYVTVLCIIGAILLSPLAIASPAFFNLTDRVVSEYSEPASEPEHECCAGENVSDTKTESCKLKCSIAIAIPLHKLIPNIFVFYSDLPVLGIVEKRFPPIYKKIRPPIV